MKDKQQRIPGSTEAAYRTWIATLGELSPRQAATAATVVRLAKQLDRDAENGGSTAALSRELRQLSAGLRDAPAPAAAAPADPVLTGTDEIALRRAERRKEVS